MPSATSTIWTGGNGSFFTPADWSAMVPALGVDATIDGTAGAPLTISFNGNGIARTLTTVYAGLVMSGGTLTLSGSDTGSFGSSITTTGVAFTQTAGLLEFQNGESLQQTSTIAGNVGAVAQSAGGTIEVDQGTLALDGNSSFAGLLSGLNGNATMQFGGGAAYTFAAAGKTGGQITVANWQVIGANTKLILGEDLTYAGQMLQALNTSVQLSGHTLTFSGTVTSSAFFAGTGNILVSNTFIDNNGGGNNTGAAIGSGVTMEVSGTVVEGAPGSVAGTSLTLGDAGRPAAVLLIDKTTGVFDFTSDGGYTGIAHGGNSVVMLNGQLEKTAGIGNNYVDSTVTMSATGLVVVTSGDIYFRGTGNSFAGSLGNAAGGSGGVVFGGGGSDTLLAGAKITTSYLTVQDALTTLVLAENFAYAGQLTQAYQTTVQLQGHILTLTGSVTSTARYAGNSTLASEVVVNAKTGTMAVSNSGTNDAGVAIGSNVTLNVAGTLSFAPSFDNTGTTLTLGDSGANNAVLLIGKTGVLDFTGDATNFTGIARGGNSAVLLKGVMEKTGGVGTDYVDATVTMSAGAVVQVASGNIYFRGANNMFTSKIMNMASSVGGVILGGIQGGSAVDTLLAGTTITTSYLTIQDSGTTVVLGENLVFAGTLAEGAGTTMRLGGNTLTLSGIITSAGMYAGAGHVVMSGSFINSDLNASGSPGNGAGASIGGGVVFEVSATGAISDGPTGGGVGTALNLGDATAGVATLEIDTLGVFDFTGDSGYDAINRTGNSVILLNGVMEKTGGTGAVYVQPTVTMSTSGSVAVSSGLIYFQGTNNSFAGSIGNLGFGAGGVVFGGNGSVSTLQTGATITTSTATVQDPGSTLVLAENLTYGGVLTVAAAATIELGSNTLTLTQGATLLGTIAGNGHIVASGNWVENGGATIGGNATLEFKGTAAASGNISVGDNSASKASMQIDAGATLALIDNVGVGAQGANTLTNLGTLDKVDGIHEAVIDPAFVNVGQVLVTIGGLQFAGSVTNDGTITASLGSGVELGATTSDSGKAGDVTVSTGAAATFDGFVASTQTLTFADNTGFATIKADSLFHGTIAGFAAGDLITLDRLTATGSTLVGNTLELTQNGVTVGDLVFAGTPVAKDFVIGSDGSGDTLVTYTSAKPTGGPIHGMTSPVSHTWLPVGHPLL